MAKRDLPQISVEEAVYDAWNALRAERRLTHADMVTAALGVLSAGDASELEALRRDLAFAREQLVATQQELAAQLRERQSERLMLDLPVEDVIAELYGYSRIPELLIWAQDDVWADRLTFLESHVVLLRAAHHRLMQFRAMPTVGTALALHSVLHGQLRPLLQSEVGEGVPFLTILNQDQALELTSGAIKRSDRERRLREPEQGSAGESEAPPPATDAE